jgi:hypothetical protein
MTVNPDLVMSQYNDLLSGKYVPADMRYGVDMLKSYRRITQRIQPLAGNSFTAGNQLTFRLPPNALIPLDSVRMVGTLSASVTTNANVGGAKFGWNKNLDFAMFQSVVVKSGGRNIDNQQNQYSLVGSVLADVISEDNAKSIRSALVNDSNINVASNKGTTVAASATGTATYNVCVKDWLGFLNSGYTISTSQEMLPNFEVHTVMNPIEYLIQADTPANISTASYTLNNPYLVFDIISFAEPNPYAMSLARLAALNIPLRMKFKNYYSISRSGVNNDFTLPLNMSSHCLQRLYVILRTTANATSGIKTQDSDTLNSSLYTRSRNGLSNARFQIGDLYMPTFWDSTSATTPYALYYLAESFGIQKDTAHGISAIKDFQITYASNNSGDIIAKTASDLFENKHYVFMQSLDHIGDYSEGVLSGLNTRNIAQDVYLQGTLSAESNVIVCGESAAVLTILPNSELVVEY